MKKLLNLMPSRNDVVKSELAEAGSDATEASGRNGISSETRIAYRKSIMKKVGFLGACIVALFLIIAVSAIVGSYNISILDVYRIIFDYLFNMRPPETMEAHVIWVLRLPRIVYGLIAGFGLAITGAAMQSLMKNPLADPYTTGISAGAGFGAAMAIIFGFELVAGQYGIVLNAFIFALIPTAVILLLSKFRKPSPTMMVLAGIAIMYIFSSLTSLFMISADPNAAQAAYTWTIGSLEKAKWANVPVMFLFVLFGSLFLAAKSKELNVLGMCDSGAKSLGVNVDRSRIVMLIVISLVTASIISFTGVIGFVGLVSPHIVRMFIGSDNKYLLIGSGLFGAVLLLGTDILARVILAPTILPVGLITAFIGAPLFLYLIISQKKNAWG